MDIYHYGYLSLWISMIMDIYDYGYLYWFVESAGPISGKDAGICQGWIFLVVE